MKRTLFAAALAALIPLAAFGGSPAKTTLTIEQAQRLFGALSSLSGHEIVVKDKDGGERVVPQAYELSAETVMAIARDAEALRADVAAYQRAGQHARAELSGGTGRIASGSASEERLNDELKPLLDQQHDYDLVHFKVGDLKIGSNKIPADVIAAMLPIIDGDR